MADIGVLFLGAASVERVDIGEAGGGVVVEVVTVVASVFITVDPIAVAVIVGVGCKMDGCECNAKYSGFVDTTEGIIEVLKIK